MACGAACAATGSRREHAVSASRRLRGPLRASTGGARAGAPRRGCAPGRARLARLLLRGPPLGDEGSRLAVHGDRRTLQLCLGGAARLPAQPTRPALLGARAPGRFRARRRWLEARGRDHRQPLRVPRRSLHRGPDRARRRAAAHPRRAPADERARRAPATDDPGGVLAALLRPLAVLQFSRKERETVEVATPSPSTEDIAQESEGAEQSSSGTAITPRPVGRTIFLLRLAAVLRPRVRSSRRETLASKRDGNPAVSLGLFEDLERELSRSRRFGHSFFLARIPRSRPARW
jgi:hypothetical protein